MEERDWLIIKELHEYKNITKTAQALFSAREQLIFARRTGCAHRAGNAAALGRDLGVADTFEALLEFALRLPPNTAWVWQSISPGVTHAPCKSCTWA